MDIVGAIVAGLVGTAVMTVLLRMAPQMGLPEMDIVGYLGAMFSAESNQMMGLVMHFVNGSIFAIIYALLWSAGVGTVNVLWGILFGIGHWLIAGAVMTMMPAMHRGIQAGALEAPGAYMMNTGGTMAFVGGLIGHIVYGVVVALVYGAFV